jgi:hypothetical protein
MISASKIFIVSIFFLICSAESFAQNTFQQQFDLAKKLYDEEKYFDAVTEFKRLLFFDETRNFSYEANQLIGLSYKEGAKFSDALHFLTLAEMNASTNEQIFDSKIEIIKINILRRTTNRALSLLDELRNDERFSDKADEINYWSGWTYIFADDWEKASKNLL